MMLAAAFLVPWCLGAAVVAACSERRTSLLFWIGAGWPAGQTCLAIVLYVLLARTEMPAESAHSWLVLGAMLGISAALWLHVWNKRSQRLATQRANDTAPATASGTATVLSANGAGRRWATSGLAVALGLGLLAKFAILLVAHLYVPVRGDDAVSLWLYKSRMIAGLEAVPVDQNDPYYMGGSNPRYPVFLSLQAAWPALATGTWHELQATWPWLITYVNLVLLIAGGLRCWLGGLASWAGAYVIAAMPLVVIHAYRPGYADLPLAAQLAAMTLCLLIWREHGSARLLVLAALFAVGAAILKREGPVVTLVAVVALLSPSWRRLAAASPAAIALGMAVGAACIAFVGMVVDVRDVGDNVQQMVADFSVLPVLLRHAFEWGSFHVTFWLMIPAAVALIAAPGLVHRWPALLLAAGLLSLDVGIFVLTPQARFAHNDQTPSRLFMQVLPAVIVVWTVALSPLLCSRAHSRTGGRANTDTTS